MAGEMLLINPRRRRRAASGGKKRRTTARRRRNPITTRKTLPNRRPAMTISGRRRTSRRRNPIGLRRRRRNPIGRGASMSGGLNVKNLMSMFKEAAVAGAGGVAFDVLWGQVNPYLPVSFQTVKGQVSVGDAVKAAATAVLGQGLSKLTKGWSKRLAMGSLTVQAYDLIGVLVPDAMPLAYASPARIVNGSPRVGPSRGGMLQAYMKPGRTALLNGHPGSSGMNAYLRAGGQSPLLNGRAGSAQMREGVSTFR